MLTSISADIMEKLKILSDAAKFDVACTSSGTSRSGNGNDMGSAFASGICHSFTADGRCISLLKILFTNECIYDCKYCINRCTNDVERVTFTPEEVCNLTVEFYRRNYIEGLFLSSGIIESPEHTMQLLYTTLFLLRNKYHFNGYVHIKTIPGASDELLAADNGKVVINDIDVSLNEDWKAFTGAFIDSGFLIDYLTPEEYFYFIGKMYGLKKEEVDERLVPFERFMNGEVMGQKKLIRNYSAGNKQKIGIISAMLHYPQLLILDEPFNFLDPSSQSIIKHLLKRYNEEHQATVIISSHNLNHTVDVCPRIALLEYGIIIRDIINEDNSAEKELEAYFNVEE